ncbi:MAG TPA: hypothetical protein VF250_05880 [Conexibacter sp.]
MQSIRTGRIAVAAAAATLIVAAVAPAADAPSITTSVRASVSPNRLTGGPYSARHGMPITLKVLFRINHPAGSQTRLQRVVVKFPAGLGKPNGNLFPSCSKAQLERARNRLSACPPGSKIGRGIAIGTAVALNPPVTSSGRLTLFNGPGGRSITFNVSVVTPALINETFSAPLRKTSGRWGYVLTNNIPDKLQNILDGPIVVRSINVTTGLTRIVRGVRRGYIEAYKCPRNGRAPLHVDFGFEGGITTRSDTSIRCIP